MKCMKLHPEKEKGNDEHEAYILKTLRFVFTVALCPSFVSKTPLQQCKHIIYLHCSAKQSHKCYVV